VSSERLDAGLVDRPLELVAGHALQPGHDVVADGSASEPRLARDHDEVAVDVGGGHRREVRAVDVDRTRGDFRVTGQARQENGLSRLVVSDNAGLGARFEFERQAIEHNRVVVGRDGDVLNLKRTGAAVTDLLNRKSREVCSVVVMQSSVVGYRVGGPRPAPLTSAV